MSTAGVLGGWVITPLDSVAVLLAIIALNSAPILGLRAVPAHVVELIAVSTLHLALVGALGLAVTILVAVVALGVV